MLGQSSFGNLSVSLSMSKAESSLPQPLRINPKMLEHTQKRALGIIFQESTYETALQRAGLQRLSRRREELCKNFFSELKQQNHVLHHLLPPRRPKMNLRHQREFETPKMRTFRLKKSPIFYGLFKFQ